MRSHFYALGLAHHTYYFHPVNSQTVMGHYQVHQPPGSQDSASFNVSIPWTGYVFSSAMNDSTFFSRSFTSSGLDMMK